MWKLLGDLLPAELKLECERAAIPPSNKSSHNSVKLAKYIMTTGYDPETFYFNTLYQADKTSNLMGMVANSGSLSACQHSSSSRANVTTGNAVNASAASTKIPSPPLSPLPLNSSAGEKQILAILTKMSSDVLKLVSLMEERKAGTAGSELGEDRSDDGSSLPTLPSWDCFESVSSAASSANSSSSSLRHKIPGGRRYDKNLLIQDKICLPYQHGTCPYTYDNKGKHTNGYGQEVLHCCGLCWTDSPENQCYYPATQCPGPDHNL